MKKNFRDCKCFSNNQKYIEDLENDLNNHFLNKESKKDIVLGDVYEYLGLDTNPNDYSVWHQGWKWDEEKQEYLDFGWL